MNNLTIPAILGPALLLGLANSVATNPPPTSTTAPRQVDLVICLDTSGSMNGLINAARQNIWAIVNDLALAKPEPKLRLSLLTFGNNGNDKEVGWVKVEAPLTDDLDLVSQKLFALTTNGGDEYVGRVLQASIDQLDWTRQVDALKLIIVAGNEGADQDPSVDFREMCSRAIAQGIIVNSIYCGNPADQLAPVWREIATRADGQFASIDQDNATVIETPFDAQLTALSASLNQTYIPYGASGVDGAANQVAQDKNAAGVNLVVSAQRAMTKSCSNYGCATWDLVDALKAGTVKLEDLKPEELPEDMRGMSPEERQKRVDAMSDQRASIQKEIGEVHEKREAWVAHEVQKQTAEGKDGFDHAVRRTVRAQAEAKGFEYRKPAAKAAQPGGATGSDTAGAAGTGSTGSTGTETKTGSGK